MSFQVRTAKKISLRALKARSKTVKNLQIPTIKISDSTLLHDSFTPANLPTSFSSDILSIPNSSVIIKKPSDCNSKKLSSLENILIASQDGNSEAKSSAIQRVLDELMCFNPELKSILMSIKTGIFDLCKEFISENLEVQRKFDESKQDLKRLMKRYKKMSLEIFDLQDKVKNYRKMKHESKVEKKDHDLLLIEKNNQIKLYKESIKELKEKVRNKLLGREESGATHKKMHLVLEIPENYSRLLTEFDSEELSSISIRKDSHCSPLLVDHSTSPLQVEILKFN